MRALSLHQPWASCVVHGFKKIETRGWRTKHRGLLAIHAAKAWDREKRETLDHFLRLFPELSVIEPVPRGGIVGVVDVVGCEPMTEAWIKTQSRRELKLGTYELDRYGWALENPRRVEPMIPLNGQRILFSLDQAVVEMIKTRLQCGVIGGAGP